MKCYSLEANRENEIEKLKQQSLVSKTPSEKGARYVRLGKKKDHNKKQNDNIIFSNHRASLPSFAKTTVPPTMLTCDFCKINKRNQRYHTPDGDTPSPLLEKARGFVVHAYTACSRKHKRHAPTRHPKRFPRHPRQAPIISQAGSRAS